MMKRDLKFVHEDICRNLGKKNRISFVHNRNQFKLSIKFFPLVLKLMLLLATIMRLKSSRWYSLMFANKLFLWKVELWQHINMEHNNKFY